LVPEGFFELIWSQFGRNAVTQDNLVAQWDESEIQSNSSLAIAQGDDIQYKSGFTFDFRIKLQEIKAGQILFLSKVQENKEIVVQTGEYGSVEIVIKDGEKVEKWNSDRGLINTYGEHCVAVSVDNGPKIIQFVIDGIVCNGRDFRQYGWTRFLSDIENISFKQLKVGELLQGQIRGTGRLTSLRIYNRPLMNTEIIGNHRNAKYEL
jgi:hypothetical protein